MAELSGAEIIAKSLKTQDVNEIVGVPVGPIASAAQKEDIRYVGVRHEQAAAYAAQAVSYINGRIAAALVVSGPGMTNAITALGNAEANCWPMILLGGASNLALANRGIRALAEVGLYKDIKRLTIPMRGRMLHEPGKEPVLQPRSNLPSWTGPSLYM